MPKLSKEAWTTAFYDVMKEPMPVSKGELKSVGSKLQVEKVEAAKTHKAAKDKAAHTRAVADDREQKRQGAAVVYDEARRATFTEEGRASARQDYEEAVESAREAEEAAKRARVALKEEDYRLKQLEAQLADISSRAESGDLASIPPALEQQLKHAQLESRLETEKAIIVDMVDRRRLREGELADARRNYRTGEAFILEGDVKAMQERIDAAKAKCDAIEVLLPGFTLPEAAVSNTDKLAETVKTLQGATQASAETLAAERGKREQAESSRGTQDSALETAAGRDPALREAFALLGTRRATLAEAEQLVMKEKADVAKAEVNYREWQKTLDDYAAGRDPQPSEDDVSNAMVMTTNRVGSLARDKNALRSQQEAVRLAAAGVASARKALGEAIDTRLAQPPANGELVLAQKAFEEADAALRRASQSEKDAADAATRAQEQSVEAKRRLTHAQKLPAAIAAGAEMNASLAGAEDLPSWGSLAEIEKAVGPANFQKMVLASRKLTNEFEALLKSGASFEELREVYKDTPDVWLPPRFRQEEQNWLAMKDLIEEENTDKYRKETDTRLAAVDKKLEDYKSKLEAGESVAGKIATGMEKSEMLKGLGVEKLAEIAEVLSKNAAVVAKAEKALGLAAKLASLMQAPVKAIDAAQKSMESEDPIETLMLQDEFMSSLGDMVEALTGTIKGLDKLAIGGAVVKQMADLLPGIGVATSAADVMKGMVASAARIQEALEDADSHTEAVDSKHQGETAIDQFARRDKHLAARATTKTGVAMIKTAAGVVDLTGVGIAASTAMKGVATGVSAVQSVAEQVVDRQEGERAKDLLDRAQAGDGHARGELFRYHPRYAKGILAVMASEGDALALKVLATHGLTDDMIRRSSPKIIKRYLLAKFGESDEPASWSSAYESFTAGVDKASALFKSVADFFDDKANWLTAVTSSSDLEVARAQLARLAYGLSTQADVSSAVGALSELRLRRDSLAASADAEQSKLLAAADKAIEDEEKKVVEVRTKVTDSMGRLRDVMGKLATLASTPQRKLAQDAGRAALREHLTRVERLAQA